MAENVNSTETNEIDYKAEYEKLQGEHAKLKRSFDDASSDISKYKKQLAENQSAEQRAQAELEEREARYKAIERENSLYKTKAKLSKTITDEKTLDQIANLYADGKYEEAIEQTNSYILASREEMRKEIKAELLKQNPQPTAQGGNATLTREEIAAISDPVERQKKMAENFHLYQN